jgi:predicted DNA-binding protein with PD1-like motif
MRYERSNDRYIIRFESGEPLIESFVAFLTEQGVAFANVSAAGAVQSARLGYWNAETRQYEYRGFNEQMEVVSFQGNVALKDGRPFPHLHGVFGRRDFSVVGGHIDEARVHPTLELWLRTEEIEVRRTRDAAIGLDLLDLPERAGVDVREGRSR